MPKRLIKKLFPNPEKIKNLKSLKFLGDVLHEPNLWHINRHAISKAFMVGIFCSFMPIPLQMMLAATIAVWINCNLPISVMLVWISNPLTIPPIFYFNYLIGSYILRRPPGTFEFELSFTWIADRIFDIGLPLYLGSLVCGLFFSVLAYVMIEVWWRRKIRKKWEIRKRIRLEVA